VDLGPDIVTASCAYNITLTNIHLCLQTHPHEDHFDPELIISRHAEYGTQTNNSLLLVGSKKTLEMLDILIQRRCHYGSLYDPHVQRAFRLELMEVTPFERYTIGRYHIIGYPANHDTEHEALLYSIACEERAIFYGTDTSIIFDDVWNDLIARNMRYDLVILDHTYGIGYASSDHLAANDFIRHVELINKKHVLKEGGHIYATHLSHEGIREHGEFQQYARRHGYHIAYDGLTIELQ
jgi:phosphoribosyl 1,2-cyclic phosphodiesterase